MDLSQLSDPSVEGLNEPTESSSEKGHGSRPKPPSESKEKKLKKIAKKNGLRERIIIDMIDEDISNVDHVTDKEMEIYNREYEDFMTKGKESMPVNPLDKVMVANIQDYVKFSQENTPAMVYFSEDLKIPLLKLGKGKEVKPHSDSTGIYYVLEGKGIIKIGMKNFSVAKGSLIHVPEGIVRSIQSEEKLTVMAIHIRK